MIYTVTLNPSLDYRIEIHRLILGKTNRNQNEKIYVGGKGINVSQVVSSFGKETCALRFIASFTVQEIIRQLHERHIHTDFVNVSGLSRINVKMKTDVETEMNGIGPTVCEKDVLSLLEKLDRLQDGDYLVLAGSIPVGVEKDSYCRMMHRVHQKRIRVIVDCEGQVLLNILPLHPFLIKPNADELSALVNEKIECYEDAIHGALYLQKMGARNVIVTLGAGGAVFVSEKGSVYVQKVVHGNVISTVGAGDSVIGGFMSHYDLGEKEAFLYGCAAGSATCFVDGLCEKSDVEKLLNRIEVVQWK